MTDKPLTDRQKQFTVLPNEANPKTAPAKAHQAIQKGLFQIKNKKPPKL